MKKPKLALVEKAKFTSPSLIQSMTHRQRIAFGTRRSLSELTDDDRLLMDYLNARGARAESAVCDDPTVPWEEFSTVIIRSCGDYHLRPFRRPFGH